MAKYCSKPVIIEAVQWHGPRKNGPTPTPEGVNYDREADKFFVVTIHGQVTYLAAEDWIITEPDGIHHYPCKPDIFVKKYELVE